MPKSICRLEDRSFTMGVKHPITLVSPGITSSACSSSLAIRIPWGLISTSTGGAITTRNGAIIQFVVWKQFGPFMQYLDDKAPAAKHSPSGGHDGARLTSRKAFDRMDNPRWAGFRALSAGA